MSTTRVTDLKQIAGRYGYRVTQIRDHANPEWFFVLDGQPVTRETPEFLLRGSVAQRSAAEWEAEVSRRAQGKMEKICLDCARRQGLHEEKVGKLLPKIFVAGRRVRQRPMTGGSCLCSFCRRLPIEVYEFADG